MDVMQTSTPRLGLQELPYIKPYPQAALGGELGLTSEDLATSLGIRHQDFRRNLRDLNYMALLEEAGFNFAQICAKTGKRGRPREFLVFGLETAKVLLAQSRTRVGLAYLKWLIACEKAVHKMAGEITRLRNRVEELETKRAYRYRVFKGTRTYVQLDLFGPPVRQEVKVYVEKTKPEMDANEEYIYLATKLTAQAEGCTKKANALLRGVEPKAKAALPAKELN